MKLFKVTRSFKKEFRRQMRFAVTAAIGFSIAFAWRESIFAMFQSFVSRFFDIVPGHYLTEIYTALMITLIGALLILLTSKVLKEEK
jgi:hypothetical protein